ncbi:MAG: hypothetical protein JSV22_14805 [Bacteroidales bacterium]|nr:MAG: hypothetical protein JSV22_14805 [Bacteroidales bacterium]
MMVSNDSISDISYTTAIAFATIIDPGEGIKQHGHCWSTNSELITIDTQNKTEKGSANSNGSYTSNLTGLSPNITYYVRAYVMNDAEVIYGHRVLSFRTLLITIPEVVTGTVTNITTTGATVSADLNSPGAGVLSVTQHGHCWSDETVTPTIDNSKSLLGPRDSTGSYESSLVGLTENTLYYVRAYATNDAGTAYGDTISFTTEQPPNIPSVVTAAVSSVTATSAICGGSITSDGSSPIVAKGVCWDTIINPNKTDNFTNNGAGSDAFVSEITGLTENKTYYVRAYATNSIGTAYGNNVNFTAADETSIPTVATTAADDISDSSAVSGGNVISDGGTDVTARGVCWNTEGTPTISDNITTDGSGTGVFTSNITGLLPVTTYFVRSYATNSKGTAYGSQISFATNASVPVVITTLASNITETSAQSGGNITSDGGAAVTARGVCWSTSEYPTVSDDYTTNGDGTGSFTSSITLLSPVTTYYVRAYATNSVGTAYGNQTYFTTNANLPTVSTDGISSITETSAQCYGNVISDGGADVSARGVCWNTSGNPTISDDNTSDGSGTGTFTGSLAGLTPNTTYYIRAYATNSSGTAYGNELDFTTKNLITISWQKCFGGSSSEVAYSIQQTTDEGYIIAVYSSSNDGDVSGNHGSGDYWIVKLNSTGDIDWQKSLGGSSTDYAKSVQQTDDGGYIAAGSSYSNDGDVSGNHGSSDYWVVKLTAAGNIDWQKSLGGSNVDEATCIKQTADGGYIIAGDSRSNDGDISGNHGNYDYWIVKLTPDGNIDWQKSFGGSNNDYARSIQQTDDEGYIIAGYSNSIDGDVSGNHGSLDYWIVKMDSTGIIDWQKSLGGSNNERAMSIQKTYDGGYIIAGDSYSNDGDVSGNYGSSDYWIVKLTSTGNIDWQKSFGGSNYDYAMSIQQSNDDGYIIAGRSNSDDGDISENHGNNDYWIVKLTSAGDLKWQKSFGGSEDDSAYSAKQTSDGGYIIAGDSFSNDGDVSGNHGNNDSWIMKIFD